MGQDSFGAIYGEGPQTNDFKSPTNKQSDAAVDNSFNQQVDDVGKMAYSDHDGQDVMDRSTKPRVASMSDKLNSS